jgi:hypothetical protein
VKKIYGNAFEIYPTLEHLSKIQSKTSSNFSSYISLNSTTTSNTDTTSNSKLRTSMSIPITNSEKQNETQEKKEEKTKNKENIPKDLKRIYAKEISSTYFFLINLYEIGNMVEKFNLKDCPTSFQFIKDTLKGIVNGWSLTSATHPKVSDYVRSKEFAERILFSLLYSMIVLTASISVLWNTIASKFYNGFPLTIVTTAIFVYSTNGSAFHLIKVRIGGLKKKKSFIFCF